ncbi:hypothetical protein OG21DRAFT_1508106 [Imleria badia]|nr:hypothetical protein OG21DRAFT_1508106 [Imleria badia]
MRHHFHYENLYDENVKVIPIDVEDRRSYLKRKSNSLGDQFDSMFDYVEEDLEEIGARDNKRRRGW